MTDGFVPSAEWIEADGLGGYAFGRADGIRTRRYHALLTVATRPPTGRTVLVNGLDAWIDVGGDRIALSSQRYTPDVTAPDGASRLVAFTQAPWPTWTYRLPSGVEVVHELVRPHGAGLVALSWRLSTPGDTRLIVRPFLSLRDAHGEHHENPDFDFDARLAGDTVRWRPYRDAASGSGGLTIVARSSGAYAHDPLWYRGFQYDDERARGLPYVEDLASPGRFDFTLGDRAVLVLAAATDDAPADPERSALECWAGVARSERSRRAAFASGLHRAADDFIVQRGAGRTIVAGYPWFSDWGRDTFIALRGLCVTGDRLGDARDVLVEWSRHVSDGMLPNFFPDGDEPAEYNSVDASLWFCIAVHDVLRVAGSRGPVGAADRDALRDAVETIVAGYARGTRFGIRADDDGLLRAGEPGMQLTWMDARVGDRVVTPRIGKPVEIQALWINALHVAAERSPHWSELAARATESFAMRFWSEPTGALFDVVDVDHVSGTHDASCRPNQIFAIGGLPWPVLAGERARRVVDVVEARLWTPAGLRSLAPGEPGYVGSYVGDGATRDAAYHQGTVWPWLTAAFVDAWIRVRGDSPHVRREARARFVDPLIAHYATSAPGHLGEIADGDPPHTPRGCPFQAWSVGEAMRAWELTSCGTRARTRPRR